MNRASPYAVLLTSMLLATSAAWGQSASLQSRSPTDGLQLPPTGAALVEDATAPEVNPAGLAQIHKFNFVYEHERSLRGVPLSIGSSGGDLVGDGLFGGLSLFEGLSLGLSLQWLRGAALPDYRKTGWTLALGGPAFAVGASYNLFTFADRELSRLRSWDLGLQLRPSRWVSLGAAFKDLQKPTLGAVQLPRRYDFSLGLRPFTDRVTLGADWLFDGQAGGRNGLLSFTAGIEPVDGVIVQAGLGSWLRSGGGVVGQVGLTLNGGYAGASYAAGGGGRERGADHLLQLRLSSERYRSILAGPARYASIDISDRLSPPRGGLAALLASLGGDPYLELLGDLSRLRSDPDVDGVVLKIDEVPLGLARAEELRRALVALRGAGKRVVAVIQNAGDSEYLIASAAEKIVALPEATLLVNGFSTTTLFFADGLGKIGVAVDVARVGAYKSAPEAFTRNNMSPEERQQLGEYLDSAFGGYVQVLGEARHLTPEKVRQALDGGIYSARAAQQAGLVDGIAYPDEIERYVQTVQGGSVMLLDGAPQPVTAPRRWGGRPDIAVVKIEGLITEGEGGGGFGMDGVAGADAIVRTLDQVRDNPMVAAVVLRIDSPGGSASASDLIWRALTRLREKKPVVVSMADVAASGGYYVAVGGDEILAEPATLTGSIGIFAAKPSFEGLLAKLGIAAETLKRGEKADIFSLVQRWTPAEQQQVQQYIEEFYDQFITKVAQSRHLDKARVDALGRGRIWSGVEAQKLGLVDAIGGLPDAIARARARAGLTGESDVVLVRPQRAATDLPFSAKAADPVIARAARAMFGKYGLAVFELGERPLAMMPYTVEVR